MIYLTIKHENGDKVISLSAEDMRTLVNHKLPMALPTWEKDFRLLKTTKRFKDDPEGQERAERASGWYYDVDPKENLREKAERLAAYLIKEGGWEVFIDEELQCPSCERRAYFGTDANFCPKCGTELVKDESQREETLQFLEKAIKEIL